MIQVDESGGLKMEGEWQVHEPLRRVVGEWQHALLVMFMCSLQTIILIAVAQCSEHV